MLLLMIFIQNKIRQFVTSDGLNCTSSTFSAAAHRLWPKLDLDHIRLGPVDIGLFFGGPSLHPLVLTVPRECL